MEKTNGPILALQLTRWNKVEYKPDDEHVIRMSLKRQKRGEARALQKAYVAILKELAHVNDEELTDVQKAEIMVRVFDQVPDDQLRDIFRHNVNGVSGLEIDGEQITTGEKLYDEADDPLLFFVLLQLIRLAKLSPTEVKASASLSTSPSPRIGDGNSPVTSTESEAGPEPSIVEVTAVPVTSSAEA